MNNYNHAKYRIKSVANVRCGVALSAGLLLIGQPLQAQNAASKPVPSKPPTAKPALPEKIQFYGVKSHIDESSLRLEGNAYIHSPTFGVDAGTIEADLKGGSITEVRAHQTVKLKINTTPKGGGAPVTIDVRSDEATAKLVSSTLILTGNVDGSYTIGKGKPNKLRGSQATLTFANQNLKVDVEGGTEGVRLELPPEQFNSAPPKPSPNTKPPAPRKTPNTQASLGTVVITSQHATLEAVLKEDDNSGTAHFTGNAHAFSNDGPLKFDATAPEFVLTRVAEGSIDTLKSVGRAQIKADFPPPPATSEPPIAVAVQPAAITQTAPGTPPNTPANRTNIGHPSHVEAEADMLTVTRPDNNMILEGNVTGLYRLSPAPSPTQPVAEVPDYHFTQDRITLTYDEKKGMQIDAAGKPGVIEAPGFDMKFGG